LVPLLLPISQSVSKVISTQRVCRHCV
jgi:hypothetical protein